GVPVAQISQYVGAWVTVNLASALINQEDPYQVVKHEMTHALTVEAWNPHLVGGGPAGPNGTLVSGVSDWATEGFARWSETAESPSARQAVDDDVARGVSAGRFAGKLPSDTKFYDPNADTMAFNYDLAATIFQFIAEKWGTANAVAVYADTVASGDMGMTKDAYAPGTDLEQALDKENLVPSSFTDPFWGMWQSYVQQLG
ncbi:MAG: hypothetical protein J2P45_30460, partial [Candidatus Dormibacteraeota bacterium]|nr:hypothetical protein [Candidatus Dormibacteraeota bacterium]